MDEIVKEGLKKWPNVPDCFGWLALDARGRWRIGEKREPISHAPTIAFIGRNYLSDSQGRWLFQNGPQRVYVELEYTPWVWRLSTPAAPWQLLDHTGLPAGALDAAFIDDRGRFILVAGAKVGVLHDHDSARLVESLRLLSGARVRDEMLSTALEAYGTGAEGGLALCWPSEGDALTPVGPIAQDALAKRFGFDPHPHQATLRP